VTPIPSPVTKKPKVIYVLLDRSRSFGSLTKKTASILVEGLNISVSPGDRLHLIWLGANENDDKYWLVETVPDVDIPLLHLPVSTFTPTPLPLPISEPSKTPTVNTPEPLLKQQAFHQTETAIASYWTVTADAAKVIATNMAIEIEKEINQKQCDQTTINSQNQILISQWQEKRSQIITEYVEKTLQPLNDHVEDGDDKATHIYNSLFYAARTIRQEKEKKLFEGYYLIILSDMEEVGSADGEDLEVDLTGVNVLMAMVSCNQSIECQRRSDNWISYFKDRGAILPTFPFRFVDETTPYVISDFLK
jgi:hypothetical protein